MPPATLAWVAEPLDETIRPEDVAAIEACIRDYFDGWFDGEADRMDRALHPALAKLAFGQDRERSGVDRTTKTEMVALTRQGLGRARAVADRALRVDVTGVSGAIASATVHSAVYMEFVLLTRASGRWQIAASVWQWAPGHGPRA